jgi:hypothetical protein
MYADGLHILKREDEEMGRWILSLAWTEGIEDEKRDEFF